MVPRETWTDERLDDLNKKVDDGFARLDVDIRGLRADLNSQGDSLRGEINALRSEMNARFDGMNNSINARFDAMNRNLIGVVVAIVAAVVGSNAFF